MAQSHTGRYRQVFGLVSSQPEGICQGHLVGEPSYTDQSFQSTTIISTVNVARLETRRAAYYSRAVRDRNSLKRKQTSTGGIVKGGSEESRPHCKGDETCIAG